MKINTLKLSMTLALCLPMVTACSNPPNAHDSAPSVVASSNKGQALEAMKWQLAGIQATGQPLSTVFKSGGKVSRIQLSFKDGRIAVTGGCNIHSASYKLSAGKQIRFGPFMSTKRACISRTKGASLMDTDREISAYLSRVSQYEIKGDSLRLSTSINEVLILKGSPTSETQYGSKGVRKFIELNNTAQGVITWREAKYNDKWIRINKNAPWLSNFPGIKDFTPLKNRNYIVRLHEYVNPKNKQVVWVKDMVTTQGILSR